MFRVFECVMGQHDHLTVALAAVIWIIGSLSFFLALERARECRADRRSTWLAIGAVAGGLGVWATHFVAMLAYDGGLPIGFAFLPTLVSAAIAVGGFWGALKILGQFTAVQCIAAGVVAGLSVCAMHFAGMQAIRVQARVEFDWLAVAVSVVIAIALFSAAFYACAKLSGVRQILVAALASVVAVCALHFTSMSATLLVFDPTLPAVEIGRGREWLIGSVVGSTIVVIILTAISTLIDRYLTDLQGFAGATLEGIVIVRDHRIIEANLRFAEMMGQGQTALVGQNIESLMLAADDCPVAELRAKPVEAAPRGAGSDQVFEVAVHEFEYRGRASQVLAVRDLTESKAAQRQIEHLARHDGLTGLPNRTLLQERLAHALGLSHRNGEPVALLAIDLDRFKAVNDIFGHAEGDRVLQSVAALLTRCVRGADTVARIGGDEFVILNVGSEQPEGARALAHRILEMVGEEMDPALDPTAVGLSIGVAIYPKDGKDAETLHHAADIALYRAKMSGTGVATFFDTQMDVDARQRRKLESDLRHAILWDEFHIVYQPLVTTIDGRRSGYEALLRWVHPERGEVSPEEFIPIAEDTGAIISIGEWVLRHACYEAAAWSEPLNLAVNISAVQFQVATLEDMVLSALHTSGLDPDRLELEITETALMKDRAETIRVLHALKRRGVRIVMDDFGTGYSSLSNLQSFPFDKIKIDRSFIQTMENDEAARSIIRAIVGIGRSLALPVVAEGVETHAQQLMVQEEGCSQAQGYFYGCPDVGPANVASRPAITSEAA